MNNHLSLALERQRRMSRTMAIVREYEDGRPIRDIAEAYGVSPALVSKYASQFGVNRRKKVKDSFPAIASDYAKGMPVKEICLKYLVDRKTVWVVARKFGLELRNPRKEEQ